MRTTRGGPVRRAPMAGLALVLLGACSSPEVAPPEIEDILLGEAVRSLPITLEDTILYGLGNDVVPAGELLFISEGVPHQVTVVDTLFNFVGRIGREGRGPGELRYPSDLEVTPGGLVTVVEGGNGRFSVFRQDGTLETIYQPIGQRAVLPLSDTSFVVTSTSSGHALEVVTPGTVSSFGPPDQDDADRLSDFQYLLPAQLEDGTPLVAHLRSSDLSFRLLDHSGAVVRNLAPPTTMSDRELERANQEKIEQTSRALGGARVLGSSAMSAGQTSPNGRWIPVSYHEIDDRPFLYDVWQDRWYRLTRERSDRAIPARPSVVIGSTLYTYELQRGLFAYELDLPE